MAKRAARRRSAPTIARRPRYRIRDERDVFITMRDGVRIALRIYRPDAAGRFPALLAASPYQYDSDDLPHSPLFLTRETGPIRWYAISINQSERFRPIRPLIMRITVALAERARIPVCPPVDSIATRAMEKAKKTTVALKAFTHSAEVRPAIPRNKKAELAKASTARKA